ncbi:hypothetical protein OH791_38470 (plasmid) [Streptomyces anulatus]|uniref:hypothetical protein n=1 Tax=Streptomyces anulatus TaxID=1892 RepID=UPI002F90D963|nr:hypothetical protein OH791_38470 [Streptomyces anulatus]
MITESEEEMATDTAPPVPAGPPDPPAPAAAGSVPAPAGDTGIMAALMAAVEPARPVTEPRAGARPEGDDPAAKADPDGAVDRSSPGYTSAVRAPEDLVGADSDAAGARHKEGVIKTLLRAGATRWAKGGGAANKRLDVAKAQAAAHQVKETRTTTVMKSSGIPTRSSSGGTGGGGQGSSGKNTGGSGRNSGGNGSVGAGRGGSGAGSGSGGRGSSGSNGGNGSGGRGSSGSNSGGESGKSRGSGGNSGGNSGGASPKNSGAQKPDESAGKGKGGGSAGNSGASGKDGGNGKTGASGNGGGSGSGGSSGGRSPDSKTKDGKGQSPKADLEKRGGSSPGSGSAGSGGKSGSSGGTGKSGTSGKDGKSGPAGGGSAGGSPTGSDRTPLQRSRETGHGDGSAVRNVVDHVQAYAKGAKDGYQDKRKENGKEHARLDKAHDQHRAKQQDPKKDDPQQQGTKVAGPDGQTLVIAPPDEKDDGMSTDVKPLLVKEIDPNTLTLGTEGAAGSVSRKELRNFKQYERKLEAKENHLVKVADACKSLEAAAEDESRDCQQLSVQAKAVKGGEKLAAKLSRLADSAKAQATEAAELRKRAQRAAEMCRVVLTNIGTRYAPLYKAVVDSDETKPAELRFYNDKGSYATAA